MRDKTKASEENKSKARRGCCGLLPLRRPGGGSKAKDSSAETKGDTASAAAANTTENAAPPSEPRGDELQTTTDRLPLGLAGISLNLRVAPITFVDSGNNGSMANQTDDNRLEEFKQLFCGGNELHSVDFIRIWGFYDKDHSGYLETKELDKFIKDLIQQKGQVPYPEMIKNVREAILRTADVNKDGLIELAEFSRCLPVETNFLTKFDARSSLSRKQFNDVFSHYDPDCNGYIEGHEILALLRDILQRSGVLVGANDLEEYKNAVIKAYDLNSDGKLSREELGMLMSVDK